MRTRLLAPVAALALAALACTSGGDPEPSPTAATTPAPASATPTEAVRAAPAAARTAEGATYTYVLAGRATGSATIDRISGVGRVDLRTGVAATRGDFGLASGGRQFDVVTRGTTYWLSVPPRNRTGYVKTPWVSTTLTSARLGMSTLGDPLTYVDALRAADAMTDAGAETVRGVATRRYVGRLVVATMIEGLPPGMREGTRAAFAGVATAHLEVWLDDAGRPWRVRTRATAGGHAVESAFDVTKYGAVAPVAVPDRVTALPRIEAALAAAGVGG